jgi:hypothetical protein
MVQLEGLGKLKEFSDLGNQIHDLKACSKAPQSSTPL